MNTAIGWDLVQRRASIRDQGATAPLSVDVMHAETIITIVVIRIMRDGVRGVYERVVATTLRDSTGNSGIEKYR